MVKTDLWTKIPSDQILSSTINAMKEKNFNPVLVNSKEDALKKIKELIPDGASVMTGSSTTLYQIGFMDDYIKNKTPWKNLGPEIFNEKDPKKQAILRRNSVIANYFIASVNAITETGELVLCDFSGSRTTAFPFAAEHLIVVVGYQKITPNIQEAMRRVREYVFPLENERAKKAYGYGSGFGKWVIMEKEIIPQRVTVILVKDSLGF